MFRREISRGEVKLILETGETIEEYPDDRPYPSRLMLGWSGSRPVHIVCAENDQEEETIVITVYEPDLEHWEEGFRRRRIS